jgi:hypothetical protein
MNFSNLKWMFMILAILLGLSLTCDVNDPTENLKVIVNTDPIETVISGSVVNGATSEPIDDVAVQFTVSGDDAGLVVNLSGASQTSFELSEGMVSFALTESADPSPDNPVELLLIAETNGYLSTSLPLKIHETGSKTFRVYMIKINDPPEGVARAEGDGQADAFGTLLQDVQVNATEPITGARSGVELPQGLILYAEDGAPLQGDLDVLLVYNNNQSDASLASFPGGFEVTVEQSGVIQEGGLFVSAGLATVEISDPTGKIAHTFGYNAGAGKRLSRALADEDTLPTISVGVPSDTYNPETGGMVGNGDAIDIWLYDVDGGVWEHQSRDTITGPDGSGNYSVKFTVDHLTPCNPDWWIQNTCTVDRMIHITGNEDRVPLTIRIKLARGAGYVWTVYNIIDEVRLWLQALLNTAYVIEAWTDCGAYPQLVGSVEVNPLCGTAPIYLPVTIPDIETTTKTISLSGYCECDENLEVRPNSNTIWYQNTECGAGSWIAIGAVVEGSLTIEGLEIGVTYLFGTWYGGRWYQLAATIYEDYSVYVPGLSTTELIESVTTEGNTISYVVRLPDEVCAEFCTSE